MRGFRGFATATGHRLREAAHRAGCGAQAAASGVHRSVNRAKHFLQNFGTQLQTAPTERAAASGIPAQVTSAPQTPIDKTADRESAVWQVYGLVVSSLPAINNWDGLDNALSALAGGTNVDKEAVTAATTGSGALRMAALAALGSFTDSVLKKLPETKEFDDVRNALVALKKFGMENPVLRKFAGGGCTKHMPVPPDEIEALKTAIKEGGKKLEAAILAMKFTEDEVEACAKKELTEAGKMPPDKVQNRKNSVEAKKALMLKLMQAAKYAESAQPKDEVSAASGSRKFLDAESMKTESSTEEFSQSSVDHVLAAMDNSMEILQCDLHGSTLTQAEAEEAILGFWRRFESGLGRAQPGALNIDRPAEDAIDDMVGRLTESLNAAIGMARQEVDPQAIWETCSAAALAFKQKLKMLRGPAGQA